MATNLGDVTLTFGVDTATFTTQLNAANAKLGTTVDSAQAKLKKLGAAGKKMGDDVAAGAHHAVTEVQATSAALRTFDGGITNNLRAAERFVANYLGLGKAMQAIFPIAGGLATIALVGELGSKVYDIYETLQKLKDAPKAIADGFRGINDPLQKSNDELSLANDKLRNEIATLSGKKTNNLAIMLDEARVASDKLTESLQKNLDETNKLLTANTTSWWAPLAGTASNAGVTKEYSAFQDKASAITLNAGTALAGAKSPAEATKIRNKETADLVALHQQFLHQLDSELAKSKALQAQWEKQGPVVGSPYGPNAHTIGGTPVLGDQSAIIAAQSGLRDRIQRETNNIRLQADNTSLTTTATGLKAAHEAATKANPFANKIAELQAQLTGARSTSSTATGDSMAQAMAKAYADSVKQIAELNNGQTKLTWQQRTQIVGLNNQIALTNLQADADKKRAATFAEIAKETDDLDQKLKADETARQQRMEKLRDTIREINAATASAGLGSEAQWQARYNAMADVTDEDKLAKQKALADHQLNTAQSVAALQRETATANGAASVANLGRDAQRQAQLNQIRNSGQAQDVINAQIAKQQAEWKLSDTQTLATGTARDGMTRYFSEMRDNVQSTAASVHDVLGGAFQGLNQTLGAIISGQKASWASLLQGIAAQVASIGLKNLEGNLFGKLLGGAGGAAKSGGGSGLFGSILGGILGGAFADGGDPPMGKASLVGERGPELFIPHTSGTIIPNNKLGGGKAAGASYFIDARGANAADVEARVQRSLVAVHGSAVKNAVAVQKEIMARSPRSRFS